MADTQKSTKSVTQAVLNNRKAIEEALLACAVTNGYEYMTETVGWLKPDHFIDGEIRQFWEHMLDTHDTSAALNAMGASVFSRFAGIIAKYSGLYNMYTDVVDLGEALLREIWFTNIALELPALAEALVEHDESRVVRILADISKREHGRVEFPDVADIGLEFISGIEDGRKPTIKTRVPKLDNAIAGLWRSSLTVICARPRIGKTALALQMARNIALDKHRVLFVSLEMGRKTLWARAVCGTVRVPYRDVLAGRIDQEALQRIIEANNTLMEHLSGNLAILDTPMSTDDIWRLAFDGKYDVIIVDHLRLLSDRGDNEVRRLGDITWNLKKIAKQYDIAVVALAQLNRALESRADKLPTLADLRDSGQIEENADVIIGLHRELTAKEAAITPAELIIMKFRDGPAPIHIRLNFDGLGQWFEERA